MWELLITLVQRFGLIATLGFLVMRIKVFRNLISGEISNTDKLVLTGVFGLIGIFGTYSGVEIYGAIANSRVIGPVVGGLIGGPLVGLGAGLIAGGHRMILGGFTGFSCGVATILEGTLAGYFAHKYGFKRITWPIALVVGLVAEALQMGLILLLARPFQDALTLVKIIGIPMTVTNAIGIAIFITIIQNIRHVQEREGAVQAQKALEIATQTLPYLKRGLTYESALETAKIIYRVADVKAVAITDNSKILAHVGEGEEHHLPGMPIQTEATRRVLEGKSFIASSKEDIGCNYPGCKLRSGVIVPLKQREAVLGVLKLYQRKENAVGTVDIKLAEGLAHLFSTQLELAELEHRAQLTAKAEIKALQAQINPHFLFNAINTITSCCRTDPELARKLLIKLADYFRKNLADGDELVPLSVELEHIKSFLAIEQVRFGGKIKVKFQTDESLLDVKLPPLTLQPLVENAIKHGLLPKKTGGQIDVTVTKDDKLMVITIKDSGVGIRKKKLAGLLEGKKISFTGLGIGLYNVHNRLKSIYGRDYGLQISSQEGEGTQVKVSIPMDNGGKNNG
jgi:two-component system sensor histidine kinase LytS